MADPNTPRRLIRERGQRAASAVPLGQRSEAIQGERAVPAAGLRAMSNVFERMSGQAARLFDREFQKEAAKVEEAATIAGEGYGLDAELPDLAKLPMGDTIAEKAFRNAALTAGRLNAEMQIRESVTRLERENEGQPQKFQALVEAEAKGFAAKLPQELQGPAREIYGRLAMSSRARLEEQQRRHQIDTMHAQLLRDTEGLTVSVAQQARLGDYGNAMEGLALLADTLAASGPVADGGSGVLTAVQIEKAIQSAQGQVRTEYMLGHLDRVGKTRGNLDRLKSGSTGDPIADAALDAMMPAEKDQLLRSLEADVNRAEAEWRARERERMASEQLALRGQIDDEVMRRRLGLPAINPPTPEQVQSAYGAEDGLAVYDRVAKALEQATIIGEVGRMTLDEQEGMLAATAPDPMTPGFAEEVERHNERRKAVAEARSELAADPAGYVVARNEPLAEAWAAVGTGDQSAYERAVELTMAEQERMGLPEDMRQPLPASVVQANVEAFTASGDLRERLAIVEQLGAVSDPAIRRRIIANFEGVRGDGGNLPAGAVARVADIASSDPNRAAKVLDALMVPSTNLNLPAMSNATFKDALDTAITSGVQAVRAKQQALTGVPSIAAVTARDMAMIEHIAKVEVQGGVDPDVAVQNAQDLLFGDLVTYDDTGMMGDGLGVLILPAGTPMAELEQGLREARNQVAMELAEGEGVLEAQQLADYRERIARRATWVNSGSGLALIDTATGEPFNVGLARLQLDDVLDLGTAALADRAEAWEQSLPGRVQSGVGEAVEAVVESETMRNVGSAVGRGLNALGTGEVQTPSGVARQ